MSLEQNCNQYHDCQPLPGSPLEGILNDFEAPKRTRRIVAKVVGPHVGTLWSLEDIQEEIVRSIQPSTGQPDWTNVIDKLREPVTRTYQGKAPFRKI